MSATTGMKPRSSRSSAVRGADAAISTRSAPSGTNEPVLVGLERDLLEADFLAEHLRHGLGQPRAGPDMQGHPSRRAV
jgi:hypothetical protein